jgi:cellulose synthase/poly-beta-1,6-N-acetylglucosamine synthase-like glycosyltransferase
MTHDAGLVAIVFWLCAAGVTYHYVGYPAIVGLLSRMAGRSRPRTERDPEPLPSVALVVAALNEEAVIADCIVNGLAIDYPTDRFEIVIASDGSSDGTAAIVRAFAGPRVRLIAFPSTRGKASVLTEVIPSLTADVVVLSDANTLIEPTAVRRLVGSLAERGVGVAVGRLVLTDAAGARNTDGLYWRYETFLKRCEARLGALLGANGAIYAIRRSLFVPLPNNTLIDDLVLPLLIKLRTRCAIVYVPDSVAHEEAPALIRSELHRRSRIGAGALASLRVLWPLLNPIHGWTAFAFASHKLLRWLSPFLLVGLFAFSLALFARPFYRYAFLAQVACYAAAVAGALVPGASRVLKPLRLATLFAVVNVGLLMGWWRWATGRREGTWIRTARPPARTDGLAGHLNTAADANAPDDLTVGV